MYNKILLSAFWCLKSYASRRQDKQMPFETFLNGELSHIFNLPLDSLVIPCTNKILVFATDNNPIRSFEILNFQWINWCRLGAYL